MLSRTCPICKGKLSLFLIIKKSLKAGRNGIECKTCSSALTLDVPGDSCSFLIAQVVVHGVSFIFNRLGYADYYNTWAYWLITTLIVLIISYYYVLTVPTIRKRGRK